MGSCVCGRMREYSSYWETSRSAQTCCCYVDIVKNQRLRKKEERLERSFEDSWFYYLKDARPYHIQEKITQERGESEKDYVQILRSIKHKFTKEKRVQTTTPQRPKRTTLYYEVRTMTGSHNYPSVLYAGFPLQDSWTHDVPSLEQQIHPTVSNNCYSHLSDALIVIVTLEFEHFAYPSSFSRSGNGLSVPHSETQCNRNLMNHLLNTITNRLLVFNPTLTSNAPTKANQPWKPVVILKH